MNKNTVKVSVDIIKDSGERASLKDILANEEKMKVFLGLSQNLGTLRSIVYARNELSNLYNQMLKYYTQEDLDVLVNLIEKQMSDAPYNECSVSRY